MPRRKRSVVQVRNLEALFLDHVIEFGGVEDFAADLTLDEFCVLIAGDDADLWMLARRCWGRHNGMAMEWIFQRPRGLVNGISLEDLLKLVFREGVATECGPPYTI